MTSEADNNLQKEKTIAEIEKLKAETALMNRPHHNRPDFIDNVVKGIFAIVVPIVAAIVAAIAAFLYPYGQSNVGEKISQPATLASPEKVTETSPAPVAQNPEDIRSNDDIKIDCKKEVNSPDSKPCANGYYFATTELPSKRKPRVVTYPPPKLSIKIATEAQRKRWDNLRKRISEDDYDVLALISVGRGAPNESEVRYFHDNAQEEFIAEKLVDTIKAKADASLKVRFVPGFEDKVKPNTFEVWLSKDAK